MIVPPVIVPPPANVNEPVLAFNTSVVPVLSNVPMIFTTLPLRWIVSTLARVNVPPRFTVEFTALMTPVLFQLP